MGAEKIITGVHPKVLDALNATVTEAKARKLSVGLFSGFRAPEEQAKLYALGRTVANPDGKIESKPMGNIVTKSEPWKSWHNFGFAGDIVFKDAHGNWTWNKTPKQWEELGVIGEIFGLEWGGRWEFKDWPHFQMRPPGVTKDEARQIIQGQGMEALWKKLT